MEQSHKILEQIIIEEKYSRTNIREKVLKDIGVGLAVPIIKCVELLTDYIHKSLGDDYYMSKKARVHHLLTCDIGVHGIITELCILILPMQAPNPIQGVVGQLGALLDYDDVFDGIKTASEIVALCAMSDLFDVIPARNSETGSIMVKSNYRLEDSTLNYISRTKYLPPMICPPKTITSNSTCGYLTLNESVILGKGNHHNEKQALDVLNLLNQTELAIDTYMVQFIEESKKPLDTAEKLISHTRMANESTEVYQDLIDQGNKFWLTWKFDKRGRINSQGYHVNIQSTSYKKSVINLHKKVLIQ